MTTFGKRVLADAPPPTPPPLAARYRLPDGTEQDCRVTDVDPDMALFLTPDPLPPGTPVVAYIEQLGRVDGLTRSADTGGVWVEFTHDGPRRARFIRHLRWLIQSSDGETTPARRHTRFEPLQPRTSLLLPGGQAQDCELLDISLSGAAIRAAVIPRVGTTLALGRMRGRVVRHFSGGFAIEFLQPLQANELHRLLR